VAFGDFARLDGYDPDAAFPPAMSAEEAAALRLRRGVVGRQQGSGAERAEGVMNAIGDILKPIVETPGRTMMPNPYPPGSELAHAFEDQRSRAANVWAGERAIDMIGTGLVSKPGAATLGSGAVRPGIKAYHGSPHDFDRFDLSKIGTGEGAQAYGHGLYFAENEGVARGYRDSLSRQVSFKGSPLGTHPMDSPVETAKHSIASLVANGSNPKGAIVNQANEWRVAAEGYARHAYNKSLPAETRQAAAREAESFNRIAAEIEKFNPDDFLKNPGRMYEVNLNARPEQFLDWDRPLSQQPHIEDVLHDRLLDRMPRRRVAEELDAMQQQTGDQIYRGLSEGHKYPVASQTLHEAGIPGIRYLDQGSRHSPAQTQALETALERAIARGDEGVASNLRAQLGNRTSNYVVFDPGIIDILRKYGLAGAGATGFGTLAAQDNYKP